MEKKLSCARRNDPKKFISSIGTAKPLCYFKTSTRESFKWWPVKFLVVVVVAPAAAAAAVVLFCKVSWNFAWKSDLITVSEKSIMQRRQDQ